MAGVNTIPKYASEAITAQERARREYIDSIIEKVHKNHEWNESSVERQALLEQYTRLPSDLQGPDVRAQLGEILVTIYNYELRRQYNEDESSDEDDDEDIEAVRRRAENRRMRRRTQEEQQKSTCLPIPLQYLYKFSNGHEPEMDLTPYLQNKSVEGGGLRVIEFPAPHCADDLFKAMRNVSLKDLVNDPRAPMEKLRFNEHSSFLAGVSYYPNVPPKQFVTSQYSRVSYPSDTFVFVAIPYLGMESVPTARFRREHPSPPNDDHLQDGVCEKMTAYYTVDGHAKGRSFSNSSLNLFEYRFPSENTPAFKDWEQISYVETEGQPIVVHQVSLAVFDDETVAVFRSPNDQSQSLPLFPKQCESVGGYHGIVNIIGNILPSSEITIPRRFRQRVSKLEFLVETRPFQEGLVIRFDTLRMELSAIIRVVETQTQVLKNLSQFQVDNHAEQFKVVRRTIENILEKRESFRSEIGVIQDNLQTSQQLLFRILSAEKKHAQAEDIAVQLSRTKRATEAAAHSARESSAESVDIMVTTIATIFMPLSLITSYWGMNMRSLSGDPKARRESWSGIRIPLSLSLVFIAIHMYCHKRLVALYRRRQSRSPEPSSGYPQSLIPLHLACVAQYAAFVMLSPWIRRVNGDKIRASRGRRR